MLLLRNVKCVAIFQLNFLFLFFNVVLLLLLLL